MDSVEEKVVGSVDEKVALSVDEKVALSVGEKAVVSVGETQLATEHVDSKEKTVAVEILPVDEKAPVRTEVQETAVDFDNDLDYPRKLNEFFLMIDELNGRFQAYMKTPGLGLNLERLVFVSQYTQVFGSMSEYLRVHQERMKHYFQAQQQNQLELYPLHLVGAATALFQIFIEKYELGSHTRIGQIHRVESTITVVQERLKNIMTKPRSRIVPFVVFMCLLVVVTPSAIAVATLKK